MISAASAIRSTCRLSLRGGGVVPARFSGLSRHGTSKHHNSTLFHNVRSSFSTLDMSAPTSLNVEMAEGVQNTTLLYLRHGLGKRRLDSIAALKHNSNSNNNDTTNSLVQRWQKMMEAFLGTQVHVLAGLGYPASEQGIALYNRHLAELLQDLPPDTQERLRVISRDTWRTVLSLAFEMDTTLQMKELTIVDARDIMHKVSQKMQDPDILELIAQRVSSSVSSSDENDEKMDMTRRHNVVQQVLVENVYLGGEPSLVEDCGFQKGEDGYVQMQCAMTEHQQDPLVSQYIGGAMMKVLQAAGIDLQKMQQQQQQQ